jgi:hypothetical protein
MDSSSFSSEAGSSEAGSGDPSVDTSGDTGSSTDIFSFEASSEGRELVDPKEGILSVLSKDDTSGSDDDFDGELIIYYIYIFFMTPKRIRL